MTLQERIKGAVRDVLRKGAYQMPDDTLPYETCAAEVTRAVAAVLPTADVSDEAIVDALYPHVLQYTDDAAYCAGDCGWVAERFGAGTARGQWAAHVAAAVRALLDAQAAAHAAEVEALRKYEGIATAQQVTISEMDVEIEALRAEVERLGQRPNYVITNPAVDAVRQAEADRDRYRDALVKISEWDCLNPPQADLLGDLPWLRSVVDNALAPDGGA